MTCFSYKVTNEQDITKTKITTLQDYKTRQIALTQKKKNKNKMLVVGSVGAIQQQKLMMWVRWLKKRA